MLKRSILALAIGACCFLTAARAASYVKMLINARTGSPVLTIATPRAGASCATRQLRLRVAAGAPMQAQSCDNKGYCAPADPNSFTFFDRMRRVASSELTLGAGDPLASDLPFPVEGPYELTWLCRESEEEQMCACIPFVNR
ncbi:MAG: hypothetical protein JNK48_11685 [Bryobacterales bacterium]|nr:hypothetical protein [Bryobacterales bacterium]